MDHNINKIDLTKVNNEQRNNLNFMISYLKENKDTLSKEDILNLEKNILDDYKKWSSNN